MPDTILFLLLTAAAAAPAAEPAKTDAPKTIREIAVPFDELHALLQLQPQRVMLSQKEYDDLLRRAATKPDDAAPTAALLTAANYSAEIAGAEARIKGELSIDVLKDGLHAVPLDLAEANIAAATLDGRPAPLGLSTNRRLCVFVEHRGRRQLQLEVVVPVAVTAAEQILRFRLPRPAASRLELKVAGDVELKSGAKVLQRTFDAAAKQTRLELVLPNGDAALALSLNSHLQGRQQAILARSVLIAEVTAAYERLYATVSFDILHRPASRLRLALPAGFEVIDAAAPELGRWSLEKEGDAPVLDLRLRQETQGAVVVRLTALRTPGRLDDWSFPQLRPLETVGHVAVVGLLLDQSLKTESLDAGGLIAIDTDVLTHALPAAALQGQAGDPPLVAVAAFYAPQGNAAMRARFTRPAARATVSGQLVLRLSEAAPALAASLTVVPESERAFAFETTLPAGWRPTRLVEARQDRALPFDLYPQPDGATRLRAAIAGGIAPGQEYALRLEAVHSDAAWLVSREGQTVEFPRLTLSAGTRSQLVWAVETGDDLAAVAQSLEQLAPLDASAKAAAGLTAAIAYRSLGDRARLALQVQRLTPRLTARTYSFFRVESDVVVCHYEIAYHVENARTRRLAFLLPAMMTTAIRSRGLGGLEIKEALPKEVEQSLRRWEVALDRPREGDVRIAIDVEQPLPPEKRSGVLLPLIRAADVAFQSGLSAVEGIADLELSVTARHARGVDIGELSDADYQPGRRLLGAYAFVAEGSEVAAELTVAAARQPLHPLPAAIVEQATLATALAASGEAVHTATFQLKTKADQLEVRLPPAAELWSATVDDVRVAPQLRGDAILVALPPKGGTLKRTLALTYRSTAATSLLAARLRFEAPRLAVRAAADANAVDLATADMTWRLQLPTGYEVVRSGGTLAPAAGSPRARPAALAVGALLYRMAGGIVGPPLLMPAMQSARESSRAARQRYVEQEKLLAEQLNAPATPAATPEAATVPQSPQPPTSALPADRMEERVEKKPGVALDARSAEPAKPSSLSYFGREKTTARKDLKGFRSLKIELQDGAGQTGLAFASFGGEPELEVVTVNRARFNALGWALALAVGLVGLGLTRATARRKTRYVLVVLVLATAAPLVFDSLLATRIANLVFFAGSLLVPYYLVAGVVRWFTAIGRRARRLPAAAAAAALALACPWAAGDDAGAIAPPLTIPESAILRPFDPDRLRPDADGALLVPLAEYERLWNRANPDKRILPKPPAGFALLGARYEATADSNESLSLRGEIGIEVFVDRPVQVPLLMAGAVLSSAELDGKPARLTVDVKPSPDGGKTAAGAASSTGWLLHVDGRGRHTLVVGVEVRTTRNGGWQIADAMLPAAPAASVSVALPREGTEVLYGAHDGRPPRVTQAAGEKVGSALLADGRLLVQWRPKLADREVDEYLTVESAGTLDVQEDVLRLAWELQLQFRAPRQSFRLLLPADYLVERVEGPNVRGWQTAGRGTGLEVLLLKPARERERLWVTLSKRSNVATGAVEFDTPHVAVAEAAAHRGRLTIRRSPIVELRVVQTAGVTRTDAPIAAEPSPATGRISPLGLRSFQAYQFGAVPFAVRLSAQTAAPRQTARVQTLLRIGDAERTLHTRFVVSVQDRPVHRFEFSAPKGFEIRRLSVPGMAHWAIRDEQDRRLVTVYLNQGRQGEVAIVVEGRWGEGPLGAELPLPLVELRSMAEQSGEIVVQADPVWQVETAALQGLEPVLMERVYGWLQPAQRATARLALSYRQPPYAGAVRLVARETAVSCRTVTNVRVTARAVEETTLLDYAVAGAGAGEFSFQMPPAKEPPRVDAPRLRQKSIERPDGPDGWWNVRLVLDDDVVGQYRVLVESDRVVTAGSNEARPPVVLAARTDRQYLALESSGRDEVVIERVEGLEAVGRQQRDWQTLRDWLGRRVTQAFVAEGKGARMVYRTHMRQAVETAGARIGLAETRLAVDPFGVYRGMVRFQVANATEQFLLVEMPAGAELWTASVAGEPVKPARAAASTDQTTVVRVPLVKTAAGDLDYAVVLKYGGSIQRLKALSHVAFPLVRTQKIEVERTHVELHLADEYLWLWFDGTMRSVEQGALEKDRRDYYSEQAGRLLQTMRHADAFARLRAATNLKNIATNAAADQDRGFALAESQLARQAEDELRRAEDQIRQNDQEDNRLKLGEAFDRQKAESARNVVDTLTSNWDFVESASAPPSVKFDAAAFDLAAPVAERSDVPERAGLPLGAGRPLGRLDELAKSKEGPSKANRLSLGVAELKDQAAKQNRRDGLAPDAAKGGEPQRGAVQRFRLEADKTVDRYKQRLEMQQGQQALPQEAAAGTVAANGALGPAGALGGGMGGGIGGMGGPAASSGVGGGGQPSRPVSTAGDAVATAPAAEPSGWASLDVELPARGRVFRFTTPRGKAELTAWAASDRLTTTTLHLLVSLAAVAAALVIAGWLAPLGRWLAGRRGTTTLIAVGILMAFLGVFPIAAMVLLVVGVALKAAAMVLPAAAAA